MNRYKVSRALWPYIRKFLVRGYYRYRIKETGDQLYCFVRIPSDMFHRIVQRAKCEKKSEETGDFWVTAREANNLLLLNLLMQDAGVTSYQVIDDCDGSRKKL